MKTPIPKIGDHGFTVNTLWIDDHGTARPIGIEYGIETGPYTFVVDAFSSRSIIR